MQRLLAFFFAAALVTDTRMGQSADALVPGSLAVHSHPARAAFPASTPARSSGARPGSEFLFAIPASGDRPMTFAAEGLCPKASPSIPRPASSRAASEARHLPRQTHRTQRTREATRELRIVIGERIALTPPMGWNSWNCWARDVTQEQVLSSARAMVESGLVNHGWTYINIDDGWQGRRGGRYNAFRPTTSSPT